MSKFSDLTDEEFSIMTFNLVCRIEDYEIEIKKHERAQGKRIPEARAAHAKLVEIVYTKLIPQSLCGKLELMDGRVIRPTKET